MKLSDYSRKRKFDKTPEPAGAPPRQAGGNSFCVQRHSARRLHYDLRLEMGGVLVSWAVPKGPTLDPGEKRLAVHVEDHPLEYGSFEGTIPAGNYGAGSVILWDRGTWELLGDASAEKQMERGDLKFKLHGEKLMGEFALVRTKRGKGNEWLLIKKKDFAAVAGYDSENDLRSVGGTLDPGQLVGASSAKMPAKLEPMMAFSSAKLPSGPDWIYEIKWDGVRALCFLSDGEVKLVGRSGRIMTAQYPELAAIAESFRADSAILDGEIVAFDENGIPAFAEIQPRITAKPSNIPSLIRTNPVTCFAFDLVHLDGFDLRAVPLLERRRMLSSRLKPGSVVRLSEHFDNGQQLLAAARERGLEGVVAKRAASAYESKRSSDWLKIKVIAQQDFVVCGMTAGERKPWGSLALGVYDDGELVYAGNVGSGFNEESLATVDKLLQPLVAKKCPFAEVPKIPGGPTTWLKPAIVATVKYNEWTRDDRLRAPVFVGLRDDVPPEECVREDSISSPETASHATTETGGAEPKHSTVSPASRQPSGGAEHRSLPRAALLPSDKTEIILKVGRQSLKFTNLNKVFYPKEGFTKRDVINYYDSVAELILPHVKDRPLSLKRYPNGIEADYFFQKDAAASFPDWLRTVPVVSGADGHYVAKESKESKANKTAEEKTINFVVADDRAALLYLANLGCIDQNPWQSRVETINHPDFMLIDLDPYHCGYDRIVEAAQLVRGKLEQIGLESYPKTTGGDGMHLYVPLEPVYTYDMVRSFAEILSRLVAAERPDLFTRPRTVAQREKGKVYFDFMQIREGSTISAPYVLRAYTGAPVSTPLRWSEVTRGLSPAHFTLRNAPDRFAKLGDIFEPVLSKPQRLESALERLEGLFSRKSHNGGTGTQRKK